MSQTLAAAYSPSITGSVGSKIAKALLAAQKAIESAKKDSQNPHFRNDYASLESVIDAVKEPLNKQGIAFVQLLYPTDGQTLGITTLLVHESGEFISGTAVVPLQKNDPQGYGSALTYARRYSLAAITGLKTVDDDAEGAVVHKAPARVVAPTQGGTRLLGNKSNTPARGKTGMFPGVSQ